MKRFVLMLFVVLLNGCASFGWKMPTDIKKSDINETTSLVVMST